MYVYGSITQCYNELVLVIKEFYSFHKHNKILKKKKKVFMNANKLLHKDNFQDIIVFSSLLTADVYVASPGYCAQWYKPSFPKCVSPRAWEDLGQGISALLAHTA